METACNSLGNPEHRTRPHRRSYSLATDSPSVAMTRPSRLPQAPACESVSKPPAGSLQPHLAEHASLSISNATTNLGQTRPFIPSLKLKGGSNSRSSSGGGTTLLAAVSERLASAPAAATHTDLNVAGISAAEGSLVVLATPTLPAVTQPSQSLTTTAQQAVAATSLRPPSPLQSRYTALATGSAIGGGGGTTPPLRETRSSMLRRSASADKQRKAAEQRQQQQVPLVHLYSGQQQHAPAGMVRTVTEPASTYGRPAPPNAIQSTHPPSPTIGDKLRPRSAIRGRIIRSSPRAGAEAAGPGASGAKWDQPHSSQAPVSSALTTPSAAGGARSSGVGISPVPAQGTPALSTTAVAARSRAATTSPTKRKSALIPRSDAAIAGAGAHGYSATSATCKPAHTGASGQTPVGTPLPGNTGSILGSIPERVQCASSGGGPAARSVGGASKARHCGDGHQRTPLQASHASNPRRLASGHSGTGQAAGGDEASTSVPTMRDDVTPLSSASNAAAAR
jgi:hypothetical protein